MHAITRTRGGTHASMFMCAIYCMCEIIVFSFAVVVVSAASSSFLAIPVFQRVWGWRGVLKPCLVESRGKASENFVLHSEKFKVSLSWLCDNERWQFAFLDELIFTLLRVWGSEFGIPNRYTGFKTALNMALIVFPVRRNIC